MAETTTSPAGPPATAPPAQTCSNCGAPLLGPYCAQCGQRAAARLISVREIFRDTLEDQFSWNSGVPRTLHALLLHPGLLTTEYVSGRIARYIPPMRLYLAASLLFFLVLSFRTSGWGGEGRPPAITVRATGVQTTVSSGGPAPKPGQGPATVRPSPGALSPPATGASTAGARATPPAAGKVAPTPAKATPPATDKVAPLPMPANRADSATGGITIDTAAGPSWLRNRLAAQQRRLAAMPPGEVSRRLFTGFMDAAPKVVFLLLPVFALLLKLLYLRRRRLYVEHFVFALHLHAVAFLVFTVFALLRSSWLNLALIAWLAVYGYLAMRRVYGQGWFRTLLKSIALGFAYLFVVMTGVVAGALIVVLSA